ncbi:uncharacterized protein LY89DRAFT_743732 [Mollisia scopiformis]|uniref:Uncharacterized protein n=1 Tax=Mollisia scopiformis TaxID=149040 RepID=A0A132B3H1_MOLSC|nr:uncharacterized protein LY89DRAFT_743732 [Mollisia scopiformis]KUJ06589.1 hypothetical protein LY89DRAFT_743732 [Mollisia scopiformis]
MITRKPHLQNLRSLIQQAMKQRTPTSLPRISLPQRRYPSDLPSASTDSTAAPSLAPISIVLNLINSQPTNSTQTSNTAEPPNTAMCRYSDVGGVFTGWRVYTTGNWTGDHGKELHSKLKKRCGGIVQWQFRYENKTLNQWNNDFWGSGDGLADFKTWKFHTKWCVERAVRDATKNAPGGLSGGEKAIECKHLVYIDTEDTRM